MRTFSGGAIGREFQGQMQNNSNLTLIFLEFKRWMAAKVPQRLESKRRRDLRQADIVQALLDEGLLMPGAAVSGAAAEGRLPQDAESVVGG